MKKYRRRAHELLNLTIPGDRHRVIFDVLLVTLIATNVLAVMLESMDSLYENYREFFFAFEVFSVVVFTCEYLTRLWVAPERRRLQAQGLGPLRSRFAWARSPSAVVDFMAFAPFYMIQWGLFGGLDLRFLRALRLLRMFKLTRYSHTMTLLLVVLRDNARTLGAVLVVMLIVMTLAACGMYLFEHEAQPLAFAHIPAAMWWAFSTLTTVGYGDVTPITAGGKMFGASITVMGVGMVALPAGILASAFSEQIRLREDLYRQVVDRALADGDITREEESELEETRLNLGLSQDRAKYILTGERQQLRGGPVPTCPHCGGMLHHVEASMEFAD
ncbi:MAG: ion transporter [Gammaproteobacteria bacterium]|nr:ion transporter [Gammaproteobacteria bacterium]MDH3768744.1 ion transporter [Gammaproteobacteria bacterium]